MTKYQKYKLLMLAIFGFLFLLIMYNYSLNGRYINIIRENDRGVFILDTKTGTIHHTSGSTKELDQYGKYEEKK